MSTQLARRNSDLPTPADWTTMMSMAEQLVASGLLPKHITTPAAAVTIIQCGIELGVPPTTALRNIVFIQGKATANSELMLALIYRDHGSDAFIWTRTDSEVAACQYRRSGHADYTEASFTIEDAKRAGLTSGPNSANYTKYPAAMLRARCISAVARMAFPDSIAGMFLPEEMGARVEMDREGGFVVIHEPVVERTVTDDGEIIDAPTVNIHEQLKADIERIVDEANGIRNPIQKGALRLLGQEAESKGLLGDPTVLEALKAAKARLTEPPAETGQAAFVTE